MPKPSDNKSLIQADNLSVAYKGKNVWSKANFSVETGEFIAVVGPNGAGKTTLFRMLLGLLQPSGGTLSLFGANATRGSELVGYVPQRRPVDTEINIEA